MMSHSSNAGSETVHGNGFHRRSGANLFIVWGTVKSGETSVVEDLLPENALVVQEPESTQVDVAPPAPLPQTEP